MSHLNSKDETPVSQQTAEKTICCMPPIQCSMIYIDVGCKSDHAKPTNDERY